MDIIGKQESRDRLVTERETFINSQTNITLNFTILGYQEVGMEGLAVLALLQRVEKWYYTKLRDSAHVCVYKKDNIFYFEVLRAELLTALYLTDHSLSKALKKLEEYELIRSTKKGEGIPYPIKKYAINYNSIAFFNHFKS